MDERHDEDGYEGPAVLCVGQAEFQVEVRLRGQFQPIDGRYHWYGRVARHDGLSAALGSARAAGMLRTAAGSAPCDLSDPDPWGRFRVTGISTPPYASAARLPPG
jgi:hypothetical protein